MLRTQSSQSHFVILNLFQDLKGILKQVQNDSKRQNGYFVYSTCFVVVKRNIDCSLRKGRMVLCHSERSKQSNWIFVRSFGLRLRMTGLRIGWIASHTLAMTRIRKIINHYLTKHQQLSRSDLLIRHFIYNFVGL